MRGTGWDYERHVEAMEYLDCLIDVTFRRHGYEEPANLSGHPDNWTPAEGDDECDLIEMVVKDENGVVLDKTQEEVEELWNGMWELIEKEIVNDDPGDYQ